MIDRPSGSKRATKGKGSPSKTAKSAKSKEYISDSDDSSASEKKASTSKKKKSEDEEEEEEVIPFPQSPISELSHPLPSS